MSPDSDTQTAARVKPAVVVEVIDQQRVVINRGSRDGIKHGLRFLVYGAGAELKDPETGESLGVLEIVRGVGVVTHVQERLATLVSARKSGLKRRKVVRRPAGVLAGFGGTEEEVIDEQGDELPFDDVEKGDYARQT